MAGGAQGGTDAASGLGTVGLPSFLNAVGPTGQTIYGGGIMGALQNPALQQALQNPALQQALMKAGGGFSHPQLSQMPSAMPHPSVPTQQFNPQAFPGQAPMRPIAPWMLNGLTR